MQINTDKKSDAPILNDILGDVRLKRLFSKDGRHCALQLWVLQIKIGSSIENRIVYGRLLPYSHSDNSWSFSDGAKFKPMGKSKARVVRLNLYVTSDYCADVLRKLSSGWSISEISEELKFTETKKLQSQFGSITLTSDKLVFRPVVYMLNRDAHERYTLSSPHASAGAFSASITQTNKKALFYTDNDYDMALEALVVKHLNEETGLDFGSTDITRIGDIELLFFPTLDDKEHSLLDVKWNKDSDTFVAKFNSIQVPEFKNFQFRLCITNGGQVAYSSTSIAEQNENNIFECKFKLSANLRARTDNTELEIFGYLDDQNRNSTLCCRWQIGYIRKINFEIQVIGNNSARTVKFDWLEKTIKQSLSMAERGKASLIINRDTSLSTNRIGGHDADPWVQVNRDFDSLFKRLHPLESDGRFFLQWGKGNGDERLQFVEWFKILLTKHKQSQIIIFDPYFEDAGLGLLLLNLDQTIDCIVFRTIPKSVKQNRPQRRQTDKNTNRGIDNLLINCEHNRSLLARSKLRIYGMKEGQLHDRYILIMAPDGLPVAGFHLSNSFQAVAENYPLLITPIPVDVLFKVEQYKSNLLKEAQDSSKSENHAIQLLFDSTVVQPLVQRHYEPLPFLEKSQAGDVLSGWLNEPSLQRLSGDKLKDKMTKLKLLNVESLTLPKSASMHSYLKQQAGNFANFMSAWEVLSEVLAYTDIEDCRFRNVEFDSRVLDFLALFLKESFERAHSDVDKELVVIDVHFFHESVDALLSSSYHMGHLFSPIKYEALTWAEYYAVKFLWWYAPDKLLNIAEDQIDFLPMKSQESNAVRLSLLSQIVSEISLSVQFDVSDEQRNRLVRSRTGLFEWMGLNAIERQLENPDGLATVLQCLKDFTDYKQVRVLGWMVNHVAKNETKVDIYKGLVAALHEALPQVILASDLVNLVDSLRGRMRQLSWAESWLFQDVILPLLQSERANTDDACKIWIKELTDLLDPKLQLLFDRVREGQVTNIASFLFAYSSIEQQETSLKPIRDILMRQKRILQQPLASTSNLIHWNNALMISMWILTFARWCQYYLRECEKANNNLERLASDANALVMLRTLDEWRAMGAERPSEISEFLDQADQLLASSDEVNSTVN